tara:strand:- start:1419 stop:2027 length:609 start_codon:yes stop_codon:yes gene_type:complete
MSYLKIGKYYGDYNPLVPTYQYKEVLDANYTDISNVELWFGAQDFDNQDYLFCRDGAIGYISNNGGFAALSDTDKQQASKHFCVSKTDRDTIYTDHEQEQNWLEFVLASELARTRRWNSAKSYLSYRINIADSNDMAIDTTLLNEQYIKYGIESEALDSKTGLFDWVNGTSIYSGSGFPTKSYHTIELQTGIMSCLSGTNYL